MSWAGRSDAPVGRSWALPRPPTERPSKSLNKARITRKGEQALLSDIQAEVEGERSAESDPSGSGSAPY